MKTFWFFRLRFRRAYDSAYDSAFRFSLGHKLSYDSDYDSDSDSVASENQPLETFINIYEVNLHTNVTEFQGEVFVDIAKLTALDVILQRS